MKKRKYIFFDDLLFAKIWQEAKDSGKSFPQVVRERIERSYWQEEILDKIQNMEGTK